MPDEQREQEEVTLYVCECGAISDNPSLEKRVPCGRRDDGWHDPHLAEYVLRASAEKQVSLLAARVEELEARCRELSILRATDGPNLERCQEALREGMNLLDDGRWKNPENCTAALNRLRSALTNNPATESNQSA